MAINFVPGQVALGDPYPNAPTVTTNPAKDVQVKVAKLTSANFTTTGVTTLVAYLPADTTILSIRTYVKTALSGNGVTSPVANVGTTTTATEFISAVGLTNTTGTYVVQTPVTGIMQNYAIPLGGDIPVYFKGTCSTGNPTAGEIYLIIEFVR